MSRSGYVDDDGGDSNWPSICWRGAVSSAMRGRRGQECFIDLLAALDAMPVKALVQGDLLKDGEVCALGSLGVRRGLDMSGLDPENHVGVARAFGIADAMCREIVYENDEGGWNETPEMRWLRMRRWVAEQIKVQAG